MISRWNIHLAIADGEVRNIVLGHQLVHLALVVLLQHVDMELIPDHSVVEDCKVNDTSCLDGVHLPESLIWDVPDNKDIIKTWSLTLE